MTTKFPRHADLFSVMRMHRGLVDLSSREPAIYDAFMRHTQDKAVYAVLEELESDPKIHQMIAEDPDRFLDDRGVVVPPGLKLVFSSSDADAATEPTKGAARAAKPIPKKFFIGYQDSGGMRWGYEGGTDGRGVVCGR